MNTLLGIAQHMPTYKKIGTAITVSDSLPKIITESSGLIFYNNELYTINDSGDGPFIYVMDSLGKQLLRTIEVVNAKNTDWEEITQDENFIYVGDFGNNYGHRDLLMIYKIPKLLVNNDKNNKVYAQRIEFSYKNKPKILTTNSQLSEYDCEAMISINDTLVLFSKNWTDTYCNIYLIPKLPGRYELSIHKTLFLDCRITGASYNPLTYTLALVGYRDYTPMVYIYNNFTINNISNKKQISKEFPLLTGCQTEGITFKNTDELLISSETNRLRKGMLLKLKIK